MSMTDPIADLLTRIRNGHQAKHSRVSIPSSRLKLEIVKIMEASGYLEAFEHEEDNLQGKIWVTLKYDDTGTPAISGLERVSKPGRRIYCGKDGIPRVLNGLGVNILSTPKGVLSGSACRKQGVGGEVLCNIW